MKNLISPLVVLLLVSGCSQNRLPDPYAGFKHDDVAQGYWKEVSSDDKSIRELHFHTKGFSVTYSPFESYKDYWGTYTLNEKKDKIRFTVDGGNRRPEFIKATGAFQQQGKDEIRIDGIALDSRKPTKNHFRFERFRSDQ